VSILIGADKFVHGLEPHQQAIHATQRYQRGFSDLDMWNFDGYLADVIVAGCNWMLERESSGDFTVPAMLDDGKDWVEILTEIRDGFDTKSEDFPDPPDSAWALLQKYFRYMWD
jgi:hypothetical protein